MQFRELEIYVSHYPQLREYFEKLNAYFFEFFKTRSSHAIVPVLVAQFMKIDEASALGLLSIYHRADILRPAYDVYCTDSGFPMGRYDSLEEIPETVLCDYHEVEHDSEALRVELVFLFTQQFLKAYSSSFGNTKSATQTSDIINYSSGFYYGS